MEVVGHIYEMVSFEASRRSVLSHREKLFQDSWRVLKEMSQLYIEQINYDNLSSNDEIVIFFKQNILYQYHNFQDVL